MQISRGIRPALRDANTEVAVRVDFRGNAAESCGVSGCTFVSDVSLRSGVAFAGSFDLLAGRTVVGPVLFKYEQRGIGDAANSR